MQSCWLMNCQPPPIKNIIRVGEKAFWVDWGADFYALRAWNNYAPNEKRTVWVGWMGSWRYIDEPVLGSISIPRSLELKSFPDGIRLIQIPLEELKTLRNSHKAVGSIYLKGYGNLGKYRQQKIPMN